jgi:hypothetical protein
MRQPDNLPAFCRVHRNGRPLIGMTRCGDARRRPWESSGGVGYELHDQVGVQGCADPLQEGNGGHDSARL